MHRDPKTKEQFIDRLLSRDFDGDLSALGESKAVLTRLAPHRLGVIFPSTGQYYEVLVRKPRGPTGKAKPRRSHLSIAGSRAYVPEPARIVRRHRRPVPHATA